MSSYDASGFWGAAAMRVPRLAPSEPIGVGRRVGRRDA